MKDSLDERYLTHSSLHDSHQPPSSNAFVCDVQEATSAVDVASEYSQLKRITPNNQKTNNKALVAFTCSPPLSMPIEITSAGSP